MVLDETNTQGNRHFRDVLIAKGYEVIYRETGSAHETIHFRATLADGLMTLLKQYRAAALLTQSASHRHCPGNALAATIERQPAEADSKHPR